MDIDISEPGSESDEAASLSDEEGVEEQGDLAQTRLGEETRSDPGQG